MDVIMARRRLLAQNVMPKGTLKYWFSGLDAPIDGAWQDKISGIRYVLYKNASTTDAETVWDQENGYYDFSPLRNYAYLVNMNNVNLNFGHHWRLEFDLYQNGASGNNTFWDFGSVNASSHAIGFALYPQNSDYPQGRMSVNWKMQGNNSNPGISSYGGPSLISNNDEFIHYQGYFAMLDGGDGYDRLYRKLNGVSDIVPIRVPRVEYGPTWSQKTSYIGRVDTNQYANYPVSVKISDLKIYVID